MECEAGGKAFPMQIHGFSKTTLLDYPEHIAATVFTGGCNFCCPFCHNGELVLDPGCQPVVSEEEVLAYLKKRQGILQGVCVTGGEPTLQKDLKEFLQKIKELDYPVKLDTNGYRPGVLWELLREHLIDYVAMDIKASRENYASAAGLKQIDLSRVEESIGILKSSGIPYEFRTTVVKGIHTVEEFESLGRWIAGCPVYYLQSYEDNENCLYRMVQAEENAVPFGAFSREELEGMARLAGKYVGKVVLRGVE